MDWKEFFKPTKKKIIASTVITVIYYYLRVWEYSQIRYKLAVCPKIECEHWPQHVGLPKCCFYFSDYILQFFSLLVIPFLVVYLVYSLVSYIIKK